MEEKEDDIMRFKWLADGCETWDEVIERLEERKKEIQKLKEQGYVIDHSCENDYLFYYKPEKK